ncbi:bifunctional ADP-dependent NAD(P)H-hydrate dehydratase/NAD(P)H-hydrate epimerase [Gloeocapsa sp. PCC 73106]|uniref:bifunctional ADP-dependent NAD(P)H-hydrate dehydratase/NAD(P)H-hydrate epimerase n=1 Tax=Gloeocapsa sp. PCC 73106 TaxID=102232 RepID=UPI0002AC2EF6|nr:bifunctional ADP-dependent NAD(P)H-hydrate dehydratase/NAD(P)H-hydrate epimerase [Gloeocapsa sp. PCC 73106]ELR97124.1 yjeF-like protein [Gloeocapsa sp. PCC 73106]
MIEQIIVTAEQMRRIEELMFAQGMPVAALMEKAALLVSYSIQQLYPLGEFGRVGILVGPGHNGGDALVVARELHLQGYQVILYRPFERVKELTEQHWRYALNLLNIPVAKHLIELQDTDFLIDGWFGFGLKRTIEAELAQSIDIINQWSQPVVSIDLPTGIETDTGEVLGKAIKATHTLCLGLWKQGLFQDIALEYLGKTVRIDFGIPVKVVEEALAEEPLTRRIDTTIARETLPLPRRVLTHKYQQGHLLLICGSLRYAGAAILTGLGAIATGVGMLSIAVPESLKNILIGTLPSALIIGCPETENGAISLVPVDLSDYQAIACGPGLTLEADSVVESVIEAPCPLILDADGLNILAQKQLITSISQRQQPTIMTPHLGEFKRLFSEIEFSDRFKAVRQAARQSNSIILLKGARTAVSAPEGETYLVGESTPALARGGSGDVLTGLVGGLVASNVAQQSLARLVATGAWWHSQGAILAASEKTELGVDAFTLSQYLCPFLASLNP